MDEQLDVWATRQEWRMVMKVLGVGMQILLDHDSSDANSWVPDMRAILMRMMEATGDAADFTAFEKASMQQSDHE